VRCGRRALAVVLFIWPFLLRTELSTYARPPKREEPSGGRPHWLVVAERYGLVPTLSSGPVTFDGGVGREDRRWLHSTGDPDSLFTLADRRGPGVRIAAAIEVNDVIPRVRAPEPDSRTAGRPRAGGDYQPADSLGNPRQLRVGARVRW